jgi:hypothetical protein
MHMGPSVLCHLSGFGDPSQKLTRAFVVTNPAQSTWSSVDDADDLLAMLKLSDAPLYATLMLPFLEKDSSVLGSICWPAVWRTRRFVMLARWCCHRKARKTFDSWKKNKCFILQKPMFCGLCVHILSDERRAAISITELSDGLFF